RCERVVYAASQTSNMWRPFLRGEGVAPVQSVPSPSPSRLHLQCKSFVVVNASSFNPPLARTNFAVSAGRASGGDRWAAMKSLRLVLPRSQVSVPRGIYSRPTVGHGVLGILSAGPRLASFAPVKASSGAAETTSVSYSTIVPGSAAKPGLRRDAVLDSSGDANDMEEKIEKVIYRCRFFTFLAVAGSLMGSVICFLKGCTYVIDSFREYFLSGGKVILMLIEAIDIYLIGTVMLVFGMGLYELFISNLDIAKMSSYGSSLLGLFKLLESSHGGLTVFLHISPYHGYLYLLVILINTHGTFPPSSLISISTPSVPSFMLHWVAPLLDLAMHPPMHSLKRDHATTPRYSLCPLSFVELLFLRYSSLTSKVIISILLVQLVLMAEPRTQEGHAPAGEIFEESHGIRHLMAWQPPTLEGHSPGVGHATPP
ncbi:unnamed protein product, partial [Musa acuminata var. zebrina]